MENNGLNNHRITHDDKPAPKKISQRFLINNINYEIKYFARKNLYLGAKQKSRFKTKKNYVNLKFVYKNVCSLTKRLS